MDEWPGFGANQETIILFPSPPNRSIAIMFKTWYLIMVLEISSLIYVANFVFHFYDITVEIKSKIRPVMSLGTVNFYFG